MDEEVEETNAEVIDFTSRLETAARNVIICWDGGGTLTELERRLTDLQTALEDYTHNEEM